MRRTSVALVALFSAALRSQPIITTLAGTDWLFPGDGRPAVDAPLGAGFGMGVAVDPAGNLYIGDADNYMVMRVGRDGILRVIGGNGVPTYSGEGGPATAAAMAFAGALALDAAGNLYVAGALDRVWRISPAGIITTFAGNAVTGYGGDNGPAVRASLNFPGGLAVDSAGRVYVADAGNNRIRRIGTDGIITTFAGNGQAALAGDGGPAASASLNGPLDVTADQQGNVYIADSFNGRVRKVTPDGIITSIAGLGFAVEDGVPAAEAILIPTGVLADGRGNLYVSDLLTHRVRRIGSDGRINTVAGNGQRGFSGDEGPAVAASLNEPQHLAVDAAGNLYIADQGNLRVRRVSPDGRITTVAGNGRFRFSGEGGPAATATLYLPTAIALDPGGNVYIAEQFGNRIRRVSPEGILTTVAGTGRQGFSGEGGPGPQADLYYPTSLVFDRVTSSLYIADQLNSRIRRLAADGRITTVAGDGRSRYNGDGVPATQASLQFPQGVAVDGLGNLYISDTNNHRVRMVGRDGVIRTIAGTGTRGFSGDGGPAAAAEVSNPAAIVSDAAGNVYFADTGNRRVRRIGADGRISTVRSEISPAGLALDAAGNLYFADADGHQVRVLDPYGSVSLVAGSGRPGLRGDGGPAVAASLSGPAGLAAGAGGALYIADRLNHRVRAVLTTRPAMQVTPATVSFTAAAEGAPPAVQRIGVTSSIPGVPFALAVTGGNWLRPSPTAGVTPAAVELAPDITGLAPGRHNVTLAVLTGVGTPDNIPVAVTLDLDPPPAPRLALKPDTLVFAGSGTQNLLVANEGGRQLEFQATLPAAEWLTVSPAAGTATAASPAIVAVRVDASRLEPGTYSTQILVTAADQRRTVPVTVSVSGTPRSVAVAPRGLTFLAVQGGGAPPAQLFTVGNAGNWTAQPATLAGGGNWLSVSPTSGGSGAILEVRVNPSGLTTGDYYGQIQITAPGADNSPQSVSVILTVLPAGANPGPVVQPTGLLFTATAGGVSPGSQTLTVANLTNRPVQFRSGRVTVDGRNWFVHLPGDGTVTADRPVRIVVQPEVGGLTPGVYRGALTLQFSEGSSRTVNLVFVVSGGGGARAGAIAQTACTPARLLPVFTTLGFETTVPAGWPSRMVVRVVDDCGNLMREGTVVADFSNNDPPVVLQPVGDGDWFGAYQARAAGSQVTIRVRASLAQPRLEGVAEVTAGVQVNQDPPVLGAGGVVSAASFARLAPVAPGSLVSIFGTRLAEQTGAAARLPLDTTMAGTTVTLGGRPLPLLFASGGQINAMVPYGLTVNTRHQLVVRRGTTITVPEPVTVAAAQPAIFTKDQSGQGQGVILDAAFRFLEPGNEARRGDAIILYCSGLGDVDPPVAAGTAAPASPLSSTRHEVTLAIGGARAQVFFAGLAPGFAGLYQINAFVPEAAPAGEAVPVVVTVAGQSSAPVTMAIR